MRKKIAVLGSTGSIGKNAVRVLESLKEYFEVTVLAADSSADLLAAQAARLGCRNVVVANAAVLDKLQAQAAAHVRCYAGEKALIDLVSSNEVDIVLCSIVGTGGLLPVLAALKAGKRVALASKEVMVMAGDLVNAVLDSGTGEIIPVDSEHSAIFQCLAGRERSEVSQLLLTASGGAFRDWSCSAMQNATVQDALQHPVWAMGRKITVDSATLMNKALEIVEAEKLFRLGADKIGVIMHRQSIVHSMVELIDGSVIAQMSQPDMRLAIQYALTYPLRRCGQLPKLDIAALGSLEFSPPDRKKYPSLDIAFAALAAGGTMPTVMNGANDVAVEAFCRGHIRLPMIWNCVQEVMSQHKVCPVDTLETAMAADREARSKAAELVKKYQI